MLADFQATYRPLIEARIAREISKRTTADTLRDAMQYSIDAGGKRLRPLLVLATAEALGAEIDSPALSIAAGLEMVHTYSLIHDDLPEMDNDDLRRGQPTNHKVFGQGIAVLAGDGLLTLAFETSALAYPGYGGFVADLAMAAGTHGMVAGQVLDIEGEEKDLSLEELMNVHDNKTGALISYAVRAGVKIALMQEAVSTAEAEKVLLHLDEYAAGFGLGFQIRDDILDVTATTEELGKTAGKDEAMDKSTYPALLGLDGAKAALNTVIAKSDLQLDTVKDILPTFHLENLRDYIRSMKIED
jgi:geranylgeranyl diphosphate synthase type II